jgi:hypothetical protein
MLHTRDQIVKNSRDGSIPEDGLRLVVDLAKKDANVSRDIPLSQVSDMTVLREAQSELAIGSRGFWWLGQGLKGASMSTKPKIRHIALRPSHPEAMSSF